jgi:hypothetical protein
MSPARSLAPLVCDLVLALFPAAAASAGQGAPISAQPLWENSKAAPWKCPASKVICAVRLR